MRRFLLALLTAAGCAHAEDRPRPLMRDFIGLCGHTVQFKPDLYAPVTRMVRDYHPIDWDATTKPNLPGGGVAVEAGELPVFLWQE